MLTWSKKVRLVPWVGNNYEKTNPKLLILGESLYNDSKDRKLVNQYIQDLIDDKWNYSFFTKLQNIFSNPEHWEEVSKTIYQLDVEKFWNDVCFHEFIQYPMEQSKQKVPKHYWEEAHDPFMEVLQQLQPDIVIALGFETYNNLPQEGEEGKTIKCKNNSMETWKYNIGDKKITVCKIQHPSSVGFKQQVWIELFGKFLGTYN